MARLAPDEKLTLRQLADRARACNGGRLPDHWVTAASSEFGVAPSTVHRICKEHGPEPVMRDSRAFRLDAEDLVEIAGARSVKLAWRRRRRRGEVHVGYRTYLRAFRLLPPAHQAGLLGRISDVRAMSLYLSYSEENRNALWQLDSTELPIRVLTPRSNPPTTFHPWAVLVTDRATRALMAAVVLAGRPRAEDIIAVLVSAIRGRTYDHRDGTVFVGGAPTAVLMDNALEHLADAVTHGLAALGTAVVHREPNSPTGNGMAERMNRTLEQMWAVLQPGFVHGYESRSGRKPMALHGDEQALLTIEQLQASLDIWADEYMTAHDHGGLPARVTPLRAWASDETPLRRFTDEELRRWFLKAGDTRRVSKNGVRFRNVEYTSPELRMVRGATVEVRYLPNDHTFIDAYHNGKYVCRAFPHAHLSEEQRRALLRARSGHERFATSIHDEAARRRGATRRRRRAMTGTGEPTSITHPLVPPARDSGSDSDEELGEWLTRTDRQEEP